MIKNLNKKKKKGFTLIELIIVIAIIGILAAISVPKFGNIRESANIKSDVANAKTIHSAVTTLLAEEKFTNNTELDEFVVDSDDDSGELVVDYLQSVPVGKVEDYKGGKFLVTVNNGTVTIKIEGTAEGKEAVAIYPVGADVYEN